ncbi:MAG: class I SAM-dependent methyltransferase [Thermoflexibacter sp.]|jgi:ubiquinone/menaquinone biosynthesis C-methylase UbiE|nr:class I SAM-dependent methyltransferase [Thermoflexibacter sp.]
MEKHYYHEYYELERKNWWFRARNQILMDRVAKLLKNKQNVKILNVGVATGSTSQLLTELGEVVSIEYDEECCNFAKQKTGLNIIQGSILDLPFDENSFDLVCAFDVIEHVEDDQKAVSELKRVCKSDGWVMVSVPAFSFLWSHHDVINHHFRRYTMPMLKAIFLKDKDGYIAYQSYFNAILFVPIAVFRLISGLIPQKWIRKGTGADNLIFPQESWVSKLLYQIFHLEQPWLINGLTFPFGISAMLCWQMQKV